MNRMNKIVNLSVDEINTIEKLETLRLQNESLKEDNELLFETNEALISEIRVLKDELQEAKQELRRLKNPRSCGMCITCIECRQSVGGEF